MKVLQGFVMLFGLCVTMPIWYWLFYQILVRVHASDVMWLLFWVYLPVGIVTGVMAKIVEYNK